MKAAIVILVLLAAGLGVALITRHNKAVEVKQDDELRISTLSNTVMETKQKLEDQERVAMTLETNLYVTKNDLGSISNNLIKTRADLEKTQREMVAAAEAAKAEIEKRDAQIAQLTSQTNALTIKMDDLTASIGNLGKLIQETERKLLAAEGDREFLLKELKRLQTEKAELEKQFNDLSVLRAQGRQAQGRALDFPAARMDSFRHLRTAGPEGRRAPPGRCAGPAWPADQLQLERRVKAGWFRRDRPVRHEQTLRAEIDRPAIPPRTAQDGQSRRPSIRISGSKSRRPRIARGWLSASWTGDLLSGQSPTSRDSRRRFHRVRIIGWMRSRRPRRATSFLAGGASLAAVRPSSSRTLEATGAMGICVTS
jgi:hypothetical protein